MKLWPFYLLPFAILAGTAAQGSGLYLFGIVVPVWLYRRELLSYASRLPLGTLAVCLATLYLVFPVIDVIDGFLPDGETIRAIPRPEHLPWAKVIRGPVTSGVLVTGTFLAILAFLNRNKTLNQSSTAGGRETSTRVFRVFTRGLSIASIILLAYVLLQATTGFDYRTLVANRTDRLMANGWYRPSGFYTHPLSLAGTALVFGSFYWSVFWQALEKRGPDLVVPLWESCGIALLHFTLVFLTAGRTAALVGALMLLGIPASSGIGHQFHKWKLAALIILAPIIALAAQLAGIWQRFREFFTDFAKPGSDHRLDFWTVHWRMIRDDPFFGHGYTWLHAFKRREYYEALGYGGLKQKFNAHNIYLEVLAQVGLIGVLVIALCIAVFLSNLRRASVREPVGALLIRAFTIALGANALHGLTQNTFFDSNLAFTYLALFLVLFWSLIDHAPFENYSVKSFS